MSEIVDIRGQFGEVIPHLKEDGSPKSYAIPNATRFEIIGEGGNPLAFTLEAGAIMQIQDDGRTVKLFTAPHVSSKIWHEQISDWRDWAKGSSKKFSLNLNSC